MAADPPNFSLFQLIFLTGDKPLLTIDDEFLRNHTKVLLRSDASDRIWEVKLNDNRLAGGWEDFAAAHNFGDGDVLVFRHDGDENFHVAVSSGSNSVDIQHASPSCVDTDDTEIDDDDFEYDDYDDGEDEDEDEDEDVDDDGGEDVGDILVNKNKKAEAEADSSSGYSCFLTARVTPYSLFKDRLDLSREFTGISFDEQKRPSEIDLVNEKGRKWTLLLSRNSSSGVFYIRRGWVNFCSANELRQGDICKFKISENGERPVLWLCPQESGNGHEDQGEEKECPEAVKSCSAGGGCSKEKSMSDEVPKGKEKKTPSPFLKLKLTPSRLKTGQLYISSVFVAKNGLNKSGEIVLLNNKDETKWTSYLRMTGGYGKEWFYLRKGWREMCAANGVEVYDSFVLKLMWEGANPIFKFYSKSENKGAGNARTRTKRACETALEERTVETEGQRESRRAERHGDEKRGQTRVSNRPATNSRKLRRTQPESCSVSDQVASVKRSIIGTLHTIRQFRAELETREGNLEASLLEIDALGERILGISQILNNKLV